MRTTGTLAVLCLLVAGCSEQHLRGSSAPSPDGLSYLLVADDNGCKKGDLLVDGKPWQFPIGAAGPIAPGTHTIACGGELSFEVPQHSIFTFSYWGP